MRTAQRAVSIDNISFMSCTIDDKKDNFATLNGSHQNQNNGSTIAIEPPPSNTSTLNRSQINGNRSTNNHVSTENLNKNSDDEQENIIPWRAQLRKTNSRLSLIG